MLLVGVLSISAVSASVVHETAFAPENELSPENASDALCIFLTGNTLGMLKPCGCSGGQLGGLDRRAAIFDGVPIAQRLIVDTGSFVEDNSEQDLIKFRILIQAFSLLHYDLVSLTQKDVEIAEEIGAIEEISSVSEIIGFKSNFESEIPAKFTRQFSLKGANLDVTVAGFDAESGLESYPIEQISELFVSESGIRTVNILILNYCDTSIIDSVAEMGIVDCIVCPAESDEPAVISNPDEKPLVISVGKYGKYVGKLEITCSDGGGNRIRFVSIPVTEELPREESLVELYKIYQQLVKEENLLEKQMRFYLPSGLKYTGSAYCELCHDYEYEKWSDGPHAHAYATLEEVGSQFDPECIVCHVVGFGYEGGYVSERTTSYLKNVGCESCHGPGLEHIQTLGKAETRGPMLDCSDCHTPEQSADYAENERLYLEKIVHWREPNVVSNVQE